MQPLGVTVAGALVLALAGCTPAPALVSTDPEDPPTISHLGSSSGSTTRASDLELPKPAGVEKGDVLLARVAARDNVSADMTAWGWEQVSVEQSAGLLKSWIFVKVAEAGEPAKYSFDISAVSPMGGSVSAFRGVDRVDPIDTFSGEVNPDARTFSTSALLTSVGNDLAVWFGTQVWAGSSCPDDSIRAPSSLTESVDGCLRSKTTGLVYNSAFSQLGAAGTQEAWTGRSAFARTNITQAVALRPAVPQQVADRYASASVDVGTFTLRRKEELWEASGLATSRRNSHVAYIHSENEHHGMVAVDTRDAAVLGRFTVPIPGQFDWEDIATGPCPAGSCLFAGDIGSSRGDGQVRSTFAVYRVPEPTIPGQISGALTGDLFRYAYPDGSHNAEALMVHPVSGEIYVITKTPTGRSGVYKFPSPLPEPSETTVATLIKVASLDVPRWTGNPNNEHAETWHAQVTAAAIHPLANRFLIRTPYRVYEYRGASGGSFESTFTATPIALTAPSGEGQGEAIDYAPDGSAYFTISERESTSYTLKRVDRR